MDLFVNRRKIAFSYPKRGRQISAGVSEIIFVIYALKHTVKTIASKTSCYVQWADFKFKDKILKSKWENNRNMQETELFLVRN